MPNCNCPAINPDELDIFSLPLDCAATWELIQQGRLKGCFQIEQNLGVHWSKEIKPNSIKELGALIALIRPSCLEAITDGKNATKHYADRKNNKEEIKPLHDSLKSLLEETFQIIIFQEQSMQIAKDIANFDLKEADSLRAAIGKKDVEKMSKVRKLFIQKAIETKIIGEEDAKYIFDIIEKSQRFSFNLSHAISYANYSYISAYIKTHFPLEFFCSWLTFAGDKPNPKLETKQLINDAKTFDIHILNPYLPDFAEHCYIADANKNVIRFGIVDIAGIGTNTFNKIKKIKFAKPIKDIGWIEFLILYSDKIDQTSMKALIGAGALDYMNANTRISRQRMFYEYDKWLKLTDKEIDWINQSLKATITSENQPNCSIDDISSLVYILKKLAPVKKNGGGTNSVNREKVILDLIKLLENPPHSLEDTVDWVIEEEERLLGIALSQSRLTAADIGIASNTTIDEFNKGKNAHQMIIAANIDSARVVKIKRGKSAGSDMAFISLSDDSGSMDAVAFSECWAEYSRLLAEGRSVMVSGNRDKLKGSFLINKVWSL